MLDQRLLEVKNLSTHFYTEEGMVKAVNQIDFFLNRGETLGIVGESGSGKSVTVLSIMRLLAKTAKIENGIITFHQERKDPIDLLSLPEKEMQAYRGRNLAMVFQEPMTSLNPVFKCGEQVAEAILLHQQVSKRMARDLTMNLFHQVKLQNPKRIFDAYPHQLSGGQKQRVMIAMALSCQPEILIADEPTTALDVTVQKAILELLNELKETTQTSIIFITHDLGVIADVADRVMVMYKGKIVEQGPVQQLFNQPQHPYTKGLLACRPPLNYRLKRLPVIEDYMEVQTSENNEIQLVEKQTSFVPEKIKAQTTQDRIEYLTAKDPFLEVKGLNTWFSSKRNFFGKTTQYVKAVNDVSFEVYPGETLGLVGESGSGKTTLGRSLLRLVKPRSGAVWYKGQDLIKLPELKLKNLRKDLQIIFQDPFSSLNPSMTVGAAIMEPMRFHNLYNNDKERQEKVVDLLETVKLEPHHFNRYPHEFSGGQRQRIGIARALSVQPHFIVCDESVSALDVSVQAQVLNLLMELREQFNLTYIFISHDLSVVKFISDRIIVMNQGKIVEQGAADEVYAKPKRQYTRQLIEAIPKGL